MFRVYLIIAIYIIMTCATWYINCYIYKILKIFLILKENQRESMVCYLLVRARWLGLNIYSWVFNVTSKNRKAKGPVSKRKSKVEYIHKRVGPVYLRDLLWYICAVYYIKTFRINVTKFLSRSDITHHFEKKTN